MASRRLTPTQKPASHRHTRWKREEATGTSFVTEITINYLDQAAVNYRDHSQLQSIMPPLKRVSTSALPASRCALGCSTAMICVDCLSTGCYRPWTDGLIVATGWPV